MYKNNQVMNICKFYKKCNRTNKDFSKYLSKDSSGKITIHKAFEIKISSKDDICDFASSFIFENCIFEKECRFEYVVFGDKELAQKKRLTINFKNCEFQGKAYFTNCVFNGEVCFNNSIFKDYADFHESIFNDTASFYNTTFESAPNFSTCVFKNIRATNFINVNIKHIDMNSIEKFIEERKADKDYANDRDLGYKIRYANNARDSFRTIKDVLIANNNLLDASQWHKLELYAKEKELEFLMEKKRDEYKIRYSNLESPKGFWLKTQAFLKNEALNLSYWLDNILLQIYRTTSEHHTNFATILNFTVIIVATQALLFCIFPKLLYVIDITMLEKHDILLTLTSLPFLLVAIIVIKLIDKDKMIAYFTQYIILFYILFAIILLLSITNINDYYILICISLQIATIMFIYFLTYYKTITIIGLIYDIVILFSYAGLLYAILFKSTLINPFIGIFNADSLIEKRLEQELQNKPNYILVSLTKDLTEQKSIKYCYDCNSAETISITKNIIRENQNKLLKQNNKNHLQNIKQAIKYDNLISDIFRTTSIIYSIILLLCIFSLQKTARKNSIIPN